MGVLAKLIVYGSNLYNDGQRQTGYTFDDRALIREWKAYYHGDVAKPAYAPSHLSLLVSTGSELKKKIQSLPQQLSDPNLKFKRLRIEGHGCRKMQFLGSPFFLWFFWRNSTLLKLDDLLAIKNMWTPDGYLELGGCEIAKGSIDWLLQWARALNVTVCASPHTQDNRDGFEVEYYAITPQGGVTHFVGEKPLLSDEKYNPTT